MFEQMISVGNEGADITSTNYFESKHASLGLFYVSWNASTARILVPDSHRSEIPEMRTGRVCVISRGKLKGVDVLEFMFDDGSDAPYALYIDSRNVDRMVKDDDKPFKVTAWTREGRAAEWDGKYRVVKTLPCLAPWTKGKARR